MIVLAQPYTTTIKYLSGATVSSSTVTDTLYVREVRLDFSTGAMYATIDRGTVVNGVFTQNYPSVQVIVNPDGSFLSDDGKWSGALQSAPIMIAQLKQQFDQFILASGSVSGTQL